MAGRLYRAAEEDLINFAGSRLPVCLCLDVSSSMNDEMLDENGRKTTKIAQLNEGIRKFYEELQRNEITKYTTEVSIVTFGGRDMKQLTEVKKVRDFSRVEIQGNAPQLSAFGLTPIGEAVNMSLGLLEERKKQYRTAGTTFYRPWLVIMSDGKPEGSSHSELSLAKETVHEYAIKKKVVPISVSIGEVEQEAKDTLRELGDGLFLPLKEGKFLDFFRWLHASVSDSTEKDVDQLMKGFLAKAKVWSDDDFLKNL